MKKSPQSIERFVLSPRTLFLAIVLVGVAFALWHIRSTILVILLAVVIASFVDSGVEVLKRFHIPRSVAVVMLYLFGVGIIAGFLYLFIPVLLDELVALADLLPADSPFANTLSLFGDGQLRAALEQVTNNPDINPFELVNQIRNQLSAANIFQGITAFFGGVVNVALVVVISFYLAMLEDGVGQFLRIVTPVRHETYVLNIWHRSKKKISGWFKGQLLLAVIQGLSTYAGLLIAGVPYALLIGLATILMSLIPYGVVLVALPAVAVGYLSGGVSLALITLGLFVLFQQLETYVWQPVIFKRATGVPSLIVIIALVIGAQLAGLMGLLLAIPVAVVILEVINDAEHQRFHHETPTLS
jgi:predicted PurR-regulated permease PerM